MVMVFHRGGQRSLLVMAARGGRRQEGEEPPAWEDGGRLLCRLGMAWCVVVVAVVNLSANNN